MYVLRILQTAWALADLRIHFLGLDACYLARRCQNQLVSILWSLRKAILHSYTTGFPLDSIARKLVPSFLEMAPIAEAANGEAVLPAAF